MFFDKNHTEPDYKYKINNEGVFNGDSYEIVYKPSHPNCSKAGYVMKHRLVLEQHLKRFLTKDEIVHHKDENKHNNGVDNLELTDRSGHRKIHNGLLGNNTHYSKKDVKELYLSGLSSREVAKKLSMSKTNVSFLVKEMGISRSHLQGKVHVNNPLNKRSVSDEEIKRMNFLFKKGYSVSSIVKMTKRSRNSVEKYLERG